MGLDEATVKRRFLAWRELMDFGSRWCMAIYPQHYPGRDPVDVLREAWRRRSEENEEAKIRMLRRISRER